ncbi:hypothetical protein KKC32_03505 [Patescibacteria group bacterium]|nr:hypothetical protein [Patescibacteria group bacterium]
MMNKIQIRDDLAKAFDRLNYEIKIEDNTVCFGRLLWDKSSSKSNLMTSAIQSISARNNVEGYLYISEQYDAADNLKKYSIQLTDNKKQSLRYYDFDNKHGLHYHEVEGNRKKKSHIKHTWNLEEIAEDILNFFSS